MRLGLTAVVVLLLGLPAAASAQELSARQQEFWNKVKALIELQDLRGLDQEVGRDMRNQGSSTEAILDQYTYRFAQTADAARLDEVRLLATAADKAESGSRFTKRIERLAAYTPEELRDWLKMRNEWTKAANNFLAALQKKEQSEFRRSLMELELVQTQAAALKDGEIEGAALYDMGLCQENLGDAKQVIDLYGRGMDAWLAGGRPKDRMYEHMMNKRNELGESEARAEVDRSETGASAEKRSSTTAYKAGSDWQEWSSEYREMKDAANPPSISPWHTDHVLLWRSFSWSEGAHPLGPIVRASPFGREVIVVRDGSKGFFDVDGDKKESKGDWPCKIIDGKPTLNVLRSGEGKDADAYAFFLLTGGEGQNWFQLPVNFGNTGFYRPACYREAKILGETVVFLDDNANGTFGDAIEQRDNILRDAPAWYEVDGLVIGKGRAIPWSDVVQIGGVWHTLKLVDPHAKKIRSRELDIETGNVVVKWNGPVQPKHLVLAEIRDFKGSYFDVAGGKPVAVPVGRYEIAFGRLETGKGMQTKQAWIFKGSSEPIEVAAGQTVTLDMGAPYKFDVETKDEGKALVVKGRSTIIRDKTGAIVGRIYDDVPLPEVSMRAKGGASLGKATAMKKPASEERDKDNSVVWFPTDLELKKSDKQDVEVQLNLKKPHPLLGGPFTSDWK